MELKPTWTDAYTVRWYECNVDGFLSVPALCNFFQETAWHHASHLGFGLEATFQKNLGWVLLVLQFKVAQYPKWLERVTLQTWPASRDKYMAYREFKIYDSESNIIGKARTTWLIVDLHTKRPKNTEVLSDLEYLTHEEMAAEFETFSFNSRENLTCIDEHRVAYSDVDHYGHTNNSKYIQWVLDAIPEPFIRSYQLQQMEIKFLQECRWGELIRIMADQEDFTKFCGVRGNDGKTNFQVKIQWKKK